jgi:hypothetical protein
VPAAGAGDRWRSPPERKDRPEPAALLEALRLEMNENERQQTAATPDAQASSEASRQQVSARLAADPHVLTEIRGLLNKLLAGAAVPARRRHDALLVADEVATNAIEHGSRRGDEIEICCTLERDRLNIVVFDRARPGIPRKR